MTTLRYLGWEGYADGSFSSSLRAATGLSILGENHLSDDFACRKLTAEPSSWDIININTPFVRDVLHPRGLIRPLPEDLSLQSAGPFQRFAGAAKGFDGDFIGIPQRCGPFNLVINRDRLSPSIAREHGFGLALNPDFHGRFGILSYEDFNVMHVAIAAGLNPFDVFDEAAISTFSDAAGIIFRSAQMITADHNVLNTSLVDGDIDFYISGGTYTASPARLAARLEICAITPERGPIDGKGGVAFVEINALVNHDSTPIEPGMSFLNFIAGDDGAIAASLAVGACNPVVQMHAARVRDRFSRDQLIAMQWDDFEEDLSRCADYAIMPDYERLREILRRTSAFHHAITEFF
jgi:spermidine/putrescine transport system substrate-binding protein